MFVQLKETLGNGILIMLVGGVPYFDLTIDVPQLAFINQNRWSPAFPARG